jgi:hypothetical protein
VVIRVRHRRWGGMYGTTHRGWKLHLLGVCIFRWRTPI